MRFVLALMLVALCFWTLHSTGWTRYLKRPLRRKDPEPVEEPVTLFDVRRFLIEGDKEAAVELYCEIFDVDEDEAVRHVEELERSLRSS